MPVFSQSVACIFIFLTVVEEEKLLSFMKFSILVFSFMIYAFGPLRNFCLLQSCDDFVSGFILEALQCFYKGLFRSVIHFEVIFVFSIRAKFFSFYLIASFNWKYFFWFFFFSIRLPWHPCWEIIDHVCVIHFWTSASVLLIHIHGIPMPYSLFL